MRCLGTPVTGVSGHRSALEAGFAPAGASHSPVLIWDPGRRPHRDDKVARPTVFPFVQVGYSPPDSVALCDRTHVQESPMTSMTPAFALDGDLAEGDAPRRSLSTRLAIAFIALLTAWMVGGVRATPAFADDDGWGDHRTSGDHRDGDHRDGDRTARSGDWSDHQRDGDARSGDHQWSDWQQRLEAAKRLAAKRTAAKTSSTTVHTTTTSHRVKAA